MPNVLKRANDLKSKHSWQNTNYSKGYLTSEFTKTLCANYQSKRLSISEQDVCTFLRVKAFLLECSCFKLSNHLIFFLFLHSIVFDGLSWKFWILNLDIFLSLNFVFLKQLLLSLQTEGSLNMIALSKIFYGLLYTVF